MMQHLMSDSDVIKHCSLRLGRGVWAACDTASASSIAATAIEETRKSHQAATAATRKPATVRTTLNAAIHGETPLVSCAIAHCDGGDRAWHAGQEAVHGEAPHAGGRLHEATISSKPQKGHHILSRVTPPSVRVRPNQAWAGGCCRESYVFQMAEVQQAEAKLHGRPRARGAEPAAYGCDTVAGPGRAKAPRWRLALVNRGGGPSGFRDQ